MASLYYEMYLRYCHTRIAEEKSEGSYSDSERARNLTLNYANALENSYGKLLKG